MQIDQITYSTKPRGGVVHTLALSEALARRGHEVTVWTLGRGGDRAFFRDLDPAVRIRVVPFDPREDETVGDRIERSIQTMRAAFAPTGGVGGIVHAQDCISANAVGRAIRTIHHLDAFTTPRLVECHERAVREPIARLCVSAAVAGEVREQYGLGATVIPNGVDFTRFAGVPADDRGVWSARLGRYVLAVGGIEPRKGSIDLLEAYAMLRTQHPDVSLVFCGGETLFDYRDYRAAFDRRAVELNVSPIVLGTLPHDAVPPLVAAADVLAFVSTKEGFGLAAMEALAAGTPVVARDLPVLREVFGGAVAYAADVAGIAAALERALSTSVDPRPGRKVAASYSWDTAAARHERFYELVSERGGDGGAPLDLEDLR
ncbi:MSMEG_0565 family glycosyltransferase [Microbacterium sp. MEC084]|uniref:MSMEG_0565 family glycosyltransferase n=1 Tax=Microbacterium sp. MEC084 TaxID=1963027 RepID=UPI00107024CC|nr:MSMEG_0565 family glycosyltransferase [Microbacterium sp. MEC084]MCD1270016.1 MSMEG_0565 family glycosyltransferase [Microbacterium sp. MEC084]